MNSTHRIGPTQGFRQRCSEMLVVELDTLKGQARPNKAGIEYPLPIAKYYNRPLVQLEAIPRQLLRFNADGRLNIPTTVSMGNLLLSLRRADKDGTFVLWNVPLSSFLAPSPATPRVLRPISFEPVVVDTRQSFIVSTVDLNGPLLLRLTYA